MSIFSQLRDWFSGRIPVGSTRSTQWPRVRAEHLAKWPTCAACGGDRDLEVHHVLPVHAYPSLELAPANLVTLCERHGCHFAFGHLYCWAAWNPGVLCDTARQLFRVQVRSTSRL